MFLERLWALRRPSGALHASHDPASASSVWAASRRTSAILQVTLLISLAHRYLRLPPCPSSQLRSNCSSDLPGWVPYKPPRAGPGGLTGLQIGLIVAGVCLLAACTALAAVLVLRWREQRRWQTLKGLDAELALVRGPAGGVVDCCLTEPL